MSVIYSGSFSTQMSRSETVVQLVLSQRSESKGEADRPLAAAGNSPLFDTKSRNEE